MNQKIMALALALVTINSISICSSASPRQIACNTTIIPWYWGIMCASPVFKQTIRDLHEQAEKIPNNDFLVDDGVIKGWLEAASEITNYTQEAVANNSKHTFIFTNGEQNFDGYVRCQFDKYIAATRFAYWGTSVLEWASVGVGAYSLALAAKSAVSHTNLIGATTAVAGYIGAQGLKKTTKYKEYQFYSALSKIQQHGRILDNRHRADLLNNQKGDFNIGDTFTLSAE